MDFFLTKMAKNREQIKKELKEQTEFLHSMLRSLEDIKKGRIKTFEFSKSTSPKKLK